MATLRVVLSPRPHPYADDPGTRPDEAWGEVAISVRRDGRDEVLLCWQWDLAELVEWFLANRSAWRSEALSIQGHGPEPVESLARALHRLRQRDFGEDVTEAEHAWSDAIYRYACRHNLRFGMRGTPIPSIILGLNAGQGEISCCEEGRDWSIDSTCTSFSRTSGARAAASSVPGSGSRRARGASGRRA